MKPGNWIITIICTCFLLGTASTVTGAGNQLDALIRAGEQGSIDAQIKLGRRYLNGAGVKEDAQRAYFWYQKAAEQGDPRGQSALGWLYEAGFGVTQDAEEAFSWYKKAAEQGHANGQYRLGLLYEKGGTGIARNISLAEKLFKKAAAQGHAKAIRSLAKLKRSLAETRPAKQRPKKIIVPRPAKKPVRKAAAVKKNKGPPPPVQDNSALHLLFGQMHEKRGEYEKAAYWYGKAAASGDRDAQAALTRLSEKPAPPKTKPPLPTPPPSPAKSTAQTSDASGPSSLLTLYQQAKKNDPQHLGALQQLAAQREGLSQAKAGLWPTIVVNGEYAKNYQKIISSDNTVYASGSTDFRSHQYTLTLTQPIFAYSSFVRVKQAKLEVKRAAVEEKILSQELILRVAERYLQALAAQDELSFTRSELKTVTRQYDLAEEKQRTGLARITDVHDARARLASVKARELEAVNLLADTLQGLQELTGVLPQSLAGLRDEIPLVSPEPGDIDSWVSAALGQNLSLAVKKQAVEIARAEIKRQRGGHFPTLELVGSHNNSLTEGTLFGGGSEVETSNVFLRANLPIFQGGYVRSKVRQATDMYRKAEKDSEQESRSVQRTARAAYSGVLSAISRVEALKQALDSQQLALEAKEEGFRSGLYTGLAVLDAERDLYLARRNYAKARYDYLLNSMRLKQAVGTLSDEDVTSLNDLFN